MLPDGDEESPTSPTASATGEPVDFSFLFDPVRRQSVMRQRCPTAIDDASTVITTALEDAQDAPSPARQLSLSCGFGSTTSQDLRALTLELGKLDVSGVQGHHALSDVEVPDGSTDFSFLCSDVGSLPESASTSERRSAANRAFQPTAPAAKRARRS